MSSSGYKKTIVFGGVILIIVVLLIITFVWHDNHIAEKSKYGVETANINILLKTIDSTYWRSPQQSLILINQLINLSEKINDKEALSMALYYKAVCYNILAQYDSAFILCQYALKFAENQNNEFVIGKLKNVLANYYLIKNEYTLANKCLMEALAIFEKLGRKKDIANVLNGFGLLYYELNQPDKAIGYYTRMIELSIESGNIRQKSVVNLNISNCYLSKNDYNMTLFFLHKALTGFQALKDSIHIMSCNMNLGIVYIEQGNIEKGLNYYFKVMEYSKRLKQKLLFGNTLFNIGNVYYENSNLVLARKYFMESLNEYRSIENKNGERNVLLELSKIEQRHNNWKQSHIYYIRYINIKDSIINSDLLKNIADLQWKYDFQKKENETTLILKKYEVKKKETVILVISFAFFIVVVLLVGALVRLAHNNLKKSNKLKEIEINHLQEKIAKDDKINKLEKLKLKAEIEAKNKELTTSSLQLITKNDILTNISGITENFYMNKAVSEECYVKLKRVLKENLDQERDWGHFKRLFEEVHKDFFKKIKLTCPEITENELRLCAYLKINLQNKEIAKLLNITSESLKTLRYRIRKKFGLEKEAILEEYIRDI